ARWVADTLQENHWAFHNFGTGMGLDGYTRVGGMAVRNYNGGPFEGAAEISAEALVEKGYRVKMEACWACSVRCKKVVKMETPYQIDPKYGGIEYESIGALGADCGVDDLALISKVNERCNALGLDTISLGATVAWIMDLRAKGLLPGALCDEPDRWRPHELQPAVPVREEHGGHVLLPSLRRSEAHRHRERRHRLGPRCRGSR